MENWPNTVFPRTTGLTASKWFSVYFGLLMKRDGTPITHEVLPGKAIRLRVNGKDFIARTELAGDAYWAFKAVGVRVPPQAG